LYSCVFDFVHYNLLNSVNQLRALGYLSSLALRTEILRFSGSLLVSSTKFDSSGYNVLISVSTVFALLTSSTSELLFPSCTDGPGTISFSSNLCGEKCGTLPNNSLKTVSC